jgi:hypothetical protein
MSDEDLEGIEDERIKTLIREARADKKQIADERKALDAERRAVVFDRLGIPEDGPGLMFRENYQGGSSPDEIKAAAEKYKVIGAPAPVVDTSQEDELARMRNSQQSVGDGGFVPNHEDEILAQMRKVDASNMAPDEKRDAIMEIVRANGLKMDTSEAGSARFMQGRAPQV